MNNIDLHYCIQKCWNCRNACQQIFFNHCLKKGGKHVEESQAKIMIDCIQICQIAADFMIRQSEYHHEICAACAAICAACAEACAAMAEDTEMQKCAEACKECAEACQSMANL